MPRLDIPPTAFLITLLLLGLALSAWFWLPALGEREATRLEEVTVGYFDYGFGDGYHFRR